MGVLEVVHPGMGASLQDAGRHGWKRFGVPPSGVMDPYSAARANRLVGNPDAAPVVELLVQGARFRVLESRRFAVAGAEAGASIPAWNAHRLGKGAQIGFPRNVQGIWSYLAVEGGFVAEPVLGSVSAYPRGGIGEELKPGAVLEAGEPALRRAVNGSWLYHGERRDFDSPPLIRVHPGPQWEWFDEIERAGFLAPEWEVSTRSDRVGYRLEGARLNPPEGSMRSEPVVEGSIQVPPNGTPIVTMRDGPTVGGYPKIAIVDPGSLPWLAQCRPGVKFRLALIE